MPECNVIRTSRVLHRAGVRCLLDGLAAAFVHDAPELVWQRTEAEAIQTIVASIEAGDRYEISVLDGNNRVGLAIVVPDEDDHVGVCLSVQWRFVLPEYRGLAGFKLQRAVLALAKHLHYNVVAYTKRTGLGTYELRYVQLRCPHG